MKKKFNKNFDRNKKKLIKYYNQIQNELNLLYDKIVLLHFFIDNEIFHILK